MYFLGPRSSNLVPSFLPGRFLLDRDVGSLAAERQDRWQSEQRHRVIVGRGAVRSLALATQTAMQDELLTVAPLDDADRRHQ